MVLCHKVVSLFLFQPPQMLLPRWGGADAPVVAGVPRVQGCS